MNADGNTAPLTPGHPEVDDPNWLAPTYFGIYLVYLFFTLESDIVHWVTMIFIPVGIVALYAGRGSRLRRTLGSLGLRRGGLGRGMPLAVGLSVAVCLFQISFSNYSAEIVALLTSSRAFVALPITFLFLLLVTAATEEFFFRGYLQTRLERLTGSRWRGLVVASILFGIYHLPYAYLNPRWPSAGDLGAAFYSAMSQGVAGGLILGGLFLYSRKNLLAPMLLHASINLLPAAATIQINFGG